jgi:NhaD family Na+/H+ antiporter
MVSLITLIFVLGYVGIVLEHPIKINKSATALVTGVLCWTVYILSAPEKGVVNGELAEHFGDVAQILFFLLGAMTIVELVDSHNGFSVITEKITQTKKTSLLWIIGIITFFLSSVLDNLTTTIVIVSLLRKLIKDPKDRMLFAGIVVIAANAGGAWSPVGDVTTTMLWIGNQITTFNIMVKLFLPSMVCLIVPLFALSFKLKGNVERSIVSPEKHKVPVTLKQQRIVFYAGIGALVMAPVFKTFTHLPPFMGILLGVGILWILTERIHKKKPSEDRLPFSVTHALHRIDLTSILFFLGILISIAALESIGLLPAIAQWMDKTIHNDSLIAMAIGFLSSIVDNVPLVAAAQGMYDMTLYPTDHFFWEFLAYAAGTGGSLLIIGSAAGVAAMGMEKIDFIWYFKNISWLALLGYLAGCGIYIAQHYLLHM